MSLERGPMICKFCSRGAFDRCMQRADVAMDILDRRYASGEIDQREYEEIKEKLSRSQ